MFIPLRGLGTLGVIADSQSQALPIGAWKDARNARFSGLSIEKMLEPTLEVAWDADTNGAPLWFQGWSDGLSSYLTIATEQYLWFLSKGSSTDTGTWVQAGGPYTAGQWQSFEWGNTCIYNNGAGAPQIFNPSTLQFEDLPGWGLISTATDLTDGSDPSSDTYSRCTVILPYKSFLVALGVTESGTYNPNTVWWSGSSPLVGYHTGSIPDWDYESPGSLSGKAEVGAGEGRLQWGAVLNENLICYTDSSATAMTLVEGRRVMNFRRLFNKGCAGLHLATEFNNQHFVVARDQIYVHDGSIPQLIAKDRVEEEFFTRAGKGGRFGAGDIDFTTMQLVKNPDRKELVLMFSEKYQGTILKPECAPYACDALRAYLTDADVSLWYAESAVYTGASPRGYSFEEASGGTSLPVYGPIDESEDTIIAGACCSSWFIYHTASGGAGGRWTSTASAPNGSEISQEAGFVARFLISDTRGVFFTQEYGYTYTAGGGGTAYPYHMTLSNLSSGPSLQVYAQSMDDNTRVHTWASLGVDPLEAHWYHVETTYAVNGTAPALTVMLYVDGALVLTESFVDQNITTVTTALANQTVWAGHLDGVDPLRTHGYFNNLYYGSVDVDDATLAWERNEEGYEAPAYCDTDAGYEPSELNRRGALVYNFEDDNFTWMDASVDQSGDLTDVVAMQYVFEPGWQTRWSDLQDDGATWDGSSGTLITATTKWSDFQSHGTEENLYWLAADGVYRSDQAVKVDGVKEYFVTRDDVDLDDIVQQWNSHNYKFAKQLFFHLEQPDKTAENSPNNFTLTMGAKNNLMDDPTWRTPVVINLEATANSGNHKADFRVTGRYLAMKFDFSATGEIRMSGAELDAEEAHGR